MRSYYVLRHLAQRHQVTLLTFVRDADRPDHIAHLAGWCHAVHPVPMRRSRLRDVKFLTQSLFTGQPFIILRDHVPAMIQEIQRLVRSEPFDAIHADQLWMAPYALAARAASLRDTPRSPDMASRPRLLLDQHNAVHLIPKRLAGDESHPLKQLFLTREARLLAAYEADVCRDFDHVVWVTEEDRRAVEALPASTSQPQPSSTVIPICADPTHTPPVARAANPRRITFLGGLHWPPNAQGVLWFADQVFPQVRAAVPEATLTVIGKDPPAGLEGEGIEVSGYVTELAPFLAETAVFIVPLHAGGGMRVKILDAWSWGLPVVSTTIGAEGIHIQNEKNLLLGDSAPAFAQAVIRVLRDPALAQRLGQNGRQTVTERYDWRVIYSAWDKVYAALSDAGGSSTRTSQPPPIDKD
jgi:glycosyltransferase involved in cell wall biosynthesis